MKTTDNEELIKYEYYYTRAGQVVVLHDWGKGQNGKIFIASRFYEGEAMSVELYPSGHAELEAPYEHEGEAESFNELFKFSPIFIVEKEYKKKAKEVIELCKSFGSLNIEIDKNKKILRDTESDIKSLAFKLNNNKVKVDSIISNKNRVKERLDELKNDVSMAEDRLGDLEQDGDNSTISKYELGNLRKTQFKMQCLEAGGIDNWDWFDESLRDFYKRYPE